MQYRESHGPHGTLTERSRGVSFCASKITTRRDALRALDASDARDAQDALRCTLGSGQNGHRSNLSAERPATRSRQRQTGICEVKTDTEAESNPRFVVIATPWEKGLELHVLGVGVTQTHSEYPEDDIDKMIRDLISSETEFTFDSVRYRLVFQSDSGIY